MNKRQRKKKADCLRAGLIFKSPRHKRQYVKAWSAYAREWARIYEEEMSRASKFYVRWFPVGVPVKVAIGQL